MEEYFHSIAEGLHGPGKFRFVIQPLIAILIGIKDGRRDAKLGAPPYFLHLLTETEERHELWKSGLRSIIKPLILSWFMDTLFQILILKHWNPFEATIVGLGLIAFPYLLARGLSNRMGEFNRQEQ